MTLAALDLRTLPPNGSAPDPTDAFVVRQRDLSDEDWARFEGYAAEILTSFGMDLTTPGTAETPRRFIRALFDATDGYDGDPKLLTAFPTECHGGTNCELAQVVEGPIPFFAPVRAPRAAVLRAGVHRLRRPRADHRDQQADPAGPGRDAAVRRAGADDPRDRRRARVDARAPRRRRLPRGPPPVHADARRPRARPDDPDERLPRHVRRAAGPPPRVRRHERDRARRDDRRDPRARGAGRRLADRAAASSPPTRRRDPLVAAPSLRRSRGDMGRTSRSACAPTGRRSCPTSSARSTGSSRSTPRARPADARSAAGSRPTASSWACSERPPTPSSSAPAPCGPAITTCGRPAMSIRHRRRRLRPGASSSGCAPQPTTVIVSASGQIDPEHPGLRATGVPVVLLTTDAGRRRDSGAWSFPPAVEVVVAGDHERVEEDAILAALAARDLDLVVCEGGPRLLGGLIGAGLVDELFLTIAPQIAGRTPEHAATRARRGPRLRDRRGPVGEPGLGHAIGRPPVPALPDVRSSHPRGRPSSVVARPDAAASATQRTGARPFPPDADRRGRSSSRHAVAGRSHRRCARRARRRGSWSGPHADGRPLARAGDQARAGASRRGAAPARHDRYGRGRIPGRRASCRPHGGPGPIRAPRPRCGGAV